MKQAVKKSLSKDIKRTLVILQNRENSNPEELKKMVEGIRKISIALGSEVKKVSSSERKNIKIARTSIVASKFIKKGEKVHE